MDYGIKLPEGFELERRIKKEEPKAALKEILKVVKTEPDIIPKAVELRAVKEEPKIIDNNNEILGKITDVTRKLSDSNIVILEILNALVKKDNVPIKAEPIEIRMPKAKKRNYKFSVQRGNDRLIETVVVEEI